MYNLRSSYKFVVPHFNTYYMENQLHTENDYKAINNKIVDKTIPIHGVFSHDVTAAVLVSQNKEMTAMLVSQTKPLGIELYFSANTFFCFSKPKWPVVT